MRAISQRSAPVHVLASGTWLLLAGAAHAASPIGTWITEGGEAKVRIVRCGDAICGNIVALREPRDPATSRPKTDENNRDPRLRSRPLIGVEIAVHMRPNGRPGQWKGQVYNPEDGGFYPAVLMMLSASRLRLEGCILRDVLCDGQTWIRAK